MSGVYEAMCGILARHGITLPGHPAIDTTEWLTALSGIVSKLEAENAVLQDELAKLKDEKALYEQGAEWNILGEIREALGVGDKPMLSELPGIVAEMRKDRERLDWVDEKGAFDWNLKDDIRQAIDAAMEDGK